MRRFKTAYSVLLISLVSIALFAALVGSWLDQSWFGFIVILAGTALFVYCAMQTYYEVDETYGDKNIYTTPRDMLKLDTAMYSDEFLSAELKDQMTKGYSFENHGTRNYGLGFRLIKMENGKNYTYHNGWWRGNTTSYIRLTDSNACIILFSNKYSKLTYKTIDLSHYLGDYPVGNVSL